MYSMRYSATTDLSEWVQNRPMAARHPTGQASQRQAGERRRAFEPQLASPPVAMRNGLARLLLGCATLTHEFC